MSQIRGGSRLSYNGEGAGGGGAVSKNCFRLFGPKFGLKVRGNPGHYPGFATANPSGYTSHW